MMTDQLPDEAQLIERSRRGDVAAFNVVVDAYQRQVYGLCLRMLGAVEAAEDATQETFISAYRHIDQYRGGLLRGWLFRIAANACTDELRRRKRRPALPIESESGGEAYQIADKGAGPEEFALRQELQDAIQAALLQLPDDQRLVVVMCDVQGFSYEETAVALQVAVGTVKSRLNRARLRLRDLLQQERELFPGVTRHVQ